MEKIASFTVNHLTLLPGIYVSRKDHVGSEVVTTFDLRMTRPNFEPVMNTAEIHTLEHLGATFLRNHADYKDKVIYFGPMGCRTGFYVIFNFDCTSRDVLDIITKMNEFVINYVGDVPGATPKDCGNYKDIDLDGAKKFAEKYKRDFLNNPQDNQLSYPN